MAMATDKFSFDTSILDRLTDSPKQKGSKQNPEALKISLARDIEDLLNTKQEFSKDLVETYPSLGDTILFYGLPDFFSFRSDKQQDPATAVPQSIDEESYIAAIQQAVVETIRTFEPRLVNPTFELSHLEGFGLRVQIRADLQAEAAQDNVDYEIVLDLESKKYSVENKG